MKKTRLIIARHGNTFAPDDIPTRVGARTDIPLVEKGRTQAQQLGQWLKGQELSPARIIAGPLKRTRETAEIARDTMGLDCAITIDERLREIDYGPDENLTEDLVTARIGADAIRDWDEKAIVPDGWKVDPQKLQQDWHDIAAELLRNHSGQNILIVTSNGTARFAPHLTGDFTVFRAAHDLKLATGAIGILEFNEGDDCWHAECWNLRPKDALQS